MQRRKGRDELQALRYYNSPAIVRLGEILGFRSRLFIDDILTLCSHHQDPMALKRQVLFLRKLVI